MLNFDSKPRSKP